MKHFDAQNPRIGFLIKEVDISKKKDLSKFLDKALHVRDLEIQSRLNKLHDKNEFFNRGDGSNFFTPPLPSNFSNLGLPPPPSDLFNIPNVARVDEFLNNNDFNFDFSNGYVIPAPNPPLIRGFARNFFPNRPLTAKNSSSVGKNVMQTMSGDRLIEELERIIEKEKPNRKNLSLMKILFLPSKNTNNS